MKLIYMIGLSYVAVMTGLYGDFFFRQDLSLSEIFFTPAILFVPILLALMKSDIKLRLINTALLLGFTIGFVVNAIIVNNNLWPIVLFFWLVCSIPAIMLFNLTCMLARKVMKVE